MVSKELGVKRFCEHVQKSAPFHAAALPCNVRAGCGIADGDAGASRV
jgi:hypothetical protein